MSDDNDGQALAAEISARIEERKAEAIERQQTRRELRTQMAVRRAAGLRLRQAAKLAQTDEGLPE